MDLLQSMVFKTVSFWPFSACGNGQQSADSVEKVGTPKQPGH
ncbi:hypothetical protein [Pseudomonas sp. PDM26]|nr:hypothetical protein [Pseudomonas sp. PDM26]